MTSVPQPQLALSFEPTLVDRFPTMRSYIAHRVNVNTKSAKTIASDMDMAPSLLSRKLTAGQDPQDKDTARFNLDDLDAYLKASGDAPAVIEYLASKFMDSPEARRARALSKVESMLPDLMAVIHTLKGDPT